MSLNPISLPQKTVYFSEAMQMYIAQTIKRPALKALDTLFNPESSNLDKIKAFKMLWDAFNALKGLPEPTLENTWHPNSHNLIRLRDWLFERCLLGNSRNGFIRRAMNFVIILYDFDPPWRWVFDSLKDEALKMDWKPRGFCDTWVNTYNWWKEKPAP